MKSKNKSSYKNNMEVTILKVAGELFVEKGFNGTSTIEIAAKAGCNQALVHYYYRTKANLFNKILSEKINSWTSVLEFIDNKDLSFLENLAITIETYFDALTEDKKVPIFLLSEMHNNHNNLLEIIKDIVQNKVMILINKVDLILQEEIKAKRIREISAIDLISTIVALTLFSFLLSPLVDYLLNISEKEAEELLKARKKEVVRTVINSLRP